MTAQEQLLVRLVERGQFETARLILDDYVANPGSAESVRFLEALLQLARVSRAHLKAQLGSIRRSEHFRPPDRRGPAWSVDC